MILVLAEYAGPLVGGPKEGMFVTSSVARIPYVGVEGLWLDGVGDSEDLIPILERIEGTYVWNESQNCFAWEFKGMGYTTR